MKVEIKELKSTRYKFNISSNKDFPLVLNTAYFLGWTVLINKKQVDIAPSKNGLISFMIPKGKNLVEVSFNDTPNRSIALLISIISFVLVLKLFFQNWYIRYK